MKHHGHDMADRFKAMVAYDPLAGLRHKKRRDGGRINLAGHVSEQAKAVDTNPTDGQKEAGNYRKGHVKVHGLDISIENPRGSWREGGPPDKRWRSKLPHHYGYIRKTEGGDGDHVDVYIGPHLKSPNVFVIDQHHLDGGKKFDEHKCFVGFGSKKQAVEAYHRAFSDGRGKDRIGHVEALTVPEFKSWIAHSDTTKAIKSHRKGYAEGGGVGDDYNTVLTPADEQGFQTWKSQNAPDDSGVDYDLRGAYQADMQRDPDNGHMGDRFKKPNHPTFSDQSQYATGDQRDRAGFWVGPEGPDQTFVPPVATRAKGGRVLDGKERAEKVLPADHKLGMRVPKGGSMCAGCGFLASPTLCGNKGFIEWNGEAKLPAPADEYCCDLYEIGKHRADGGRVHMADGGAPTWDNTQPVADGPTWDNTQPVDNSGTASMPPEAADHGLSERQKLSPVEKALSPITGYWDTYQRMMHESLDQASKGVQQILHPDSLIDPQAHGIADVASGLGNVAAGTVGYVTSPASAAYRSIAGQPIEDNTGIPREYTEFAAQLATPGVGLPRVGAGAPIVGPAPATATEAASARLGVPISRAAASDSPAVQSAAGALKEVPFVGTPLVKSAKQTLTGLDDAAKDTAAAYGSADTVTAGEAAKSGLEDWITGKSGDIAKRVYGRVDSMVDPAFERPLHATADTVSDIMARRSNAKISGVSPAVSEVQDAVTSPGMTYSGLKDLRSHIGNMTPQEMISKGINPGEAKQIYGALTQDLRGHILDAGGPDALTTFDKANGVYSQIVDRRKALSKIIGVKADAPPERVMDRMLQLASSKGGADQSTLMQARKAIGPDKWNEVTSSAIDRMGRSAPGADFSGDRFVTAWNNLSDRGRRTLFNSTGKPELAQNVEDIMTLSKNYKQLAAMGNPSGTGRVNAIMSALGALGGAVAGTATIGLAAPIAMLTSTLGGRTVAKVLSTPVAAKSAAQWAKAYTNAVKSGGSPASVAALAPATQRLMERVKAYTGPNLGPLQGPMPANANDKQQ